MRRPWYTLFFATVPLYLNYQSLLHDTGGNPLPSGPATLTFRITDVDHHPLYEEQQGVDIANGVVTALIGNGVDPVAQAPTVGLTPDLFLPGAARYLEVDVDGVPADDPLELVTVPYALWSQRVAEGGVDAKAISAGAVEFGHLANGLIDDLAAALTASPAFQEGLAAAGTAASIGVDTTFLYSGATTVQGVLKDLDLAIKSREEKNVSRAGDTMSGTLTFQNGARVTGLPPPEALTDAVPKAFVDQIVAGLSDDLDAEKSARAEADTALQLSVDNAITGEATARAAADTTLQTNLTGESQARASADTALQSNIAGEATTRAAADATLKVELDAVAASIPPAPPPPPPVPSISAQLLTTVGTFVPDVWNGDVYTGTIPTPANPPVPCVYHAAFAGTSGSLNFQEPVNAGKDFHIEFQLNGNSVGCAVKGDKLPGELGKIPCRVSYLTLCMKD